MTVLRHLPLLVIAALVLGCGGGNEAGGHAQGSEPPPAAQVTPRLDGVYTAEMGGVTYMMRFFRDGQVMNTAALTRDATPDAKGKARVDLRGLLVPSTPTGGNSTVMRSPVHLSCDSVLFTTRNARTEIDYRGLMLGWDSIRFHKYSHLNGNAVTLTFRFQPDPLRAQ